jgi:hypothetical protein
VNKQYCLTKLFPALALIILTPGSAGHLVHAAICPASESATIDGCSLAEYIDPDFPYLDSEVSVSFMEMKHFVSIKAKNHQDSTDSWLMTDDVTGFPIDNPKYHLKARLGDDTVTGMLKISGEIAGEKFRISTRLDGEIETSGDGTQWQFNTTGTDCGGLISALAGECLTGKVYLELDETPATEGEPGRIITDGRTVTDLPSTAAVPVPAAAWLFGSGLIALAGITRRWNS